MTAWPILIAVLCILAIAYRFYSKFIASKVLELNDSRITPAFRHEDGHNYHPTNPYILFGHHFAAISGAGPLIGPVLAAQFGYLPGLLWLLIGVVLAGAVQDFIILTISMRYDGKSLSDIASKELGKWGALLTSICVLFVIIIALSGLGIVVVNALAESTWGVFTIFMTIPIALFMGIALHTFAQNKILLVSLLGFIALIASLILGKYVSESSWGYYLFLSKNQITIAMMLYGFLASVLPVWLLLCPRDYLSSFMKIGTIALLVLAILFVNPEIKIPAITQYIHGGGPIIPGKVFPFVFITIMCGAISGFHALVASGTTPKMISRESHARPIGYGAMLIEALVGIVALIAACNLQPGDYFAINTSVEKFETLKVFGYHIEEIPVLETQIQEKIQGRTGGAVTLAVGMAKILSSLPLLGHLLSYWYHFAILFEALFILTTIDTGTRIARFVFQELLGVRFKKFKKMDWLPGTLFTSLFTVLAWGYFIWTGSVATIWPMFGIANQMLAVTALSIASHYLARNKKVKYLWVTLVPLIFVFFTTSFAAYELIFVQKLSTINLFFTMVILASTWGILFLSLSGIYSKFKLRPLNLGK